MLPVDYIPGADAILMSRLIGMLRKSTQAAVRFVNAVDAALTVIAANPQRFAEVDNVHRECPVRRFPFRIIYRVVEDRHCRRGHRSRKTAARLLETAELSFMMECLVLRYTLSQLSVRSLVQSTSIYALGRGNVLLQPNCGYRNACLTRGKFWKKCSHHALNTNQPRNYMSAHLVAQIGTLKLF